MIFETKSSFFDITVVLNLIIIFMYFDAIYLDKNNVHYTRYKKTVWLLEAVSTSCNKSANDSCNKPVFCCVMRLKLRYAREIFIII